jgi:hypothetical protein
MPTRVAAMTALAVLAAIAPAAGQETPAPVDVAPGPAAESTATPGASQAPTPPPSGESGPYGILLGTNIREDSWCRVLVPNKKGDAARADSILGDGVVDLGQYGTFRLSDKKWWDPQPTLDSSGNTHINGLYWTTPLLYTGAERGDSEMVREFFRLIAEWLRGHRSTKTRTWAVTQPIVAGERLWTLTCASDISGGARFVKATRKEATTRLRRFQLGGGTNNTALHSQGSALAAFCYLGEPGNRDRAARNLAALADYLVLPDGSDREGSPWYAYYTLRLMIDLAPVYQRCGVEYAPIAEAITRAERFLASAVDPGYHLAMLGDTHRAQLGPNWFPEDSVARWAATRGTDGQPPASLYDVFAGGYVFGRSSWTPLDGRQPTFYSVRIARPYTTAHVHSDLGSVTFHSHGQEFLGDPGPYRYDNSRTRDYIVGRSAHSVIRVAALKPGRNPTKTRARGTLGLRATAAAVGANGSKVLTTRTGPYDRSCLRDRTYSSATITRCVLYDPLTDALIVTDRVRAQGRIRAEQRWQVPPGVTVTVSGGGARLEAAGAAATMRFAGGGTLRTFRPGARGPDGWFTRGYGQLDRGTVIQRRAVFAKGTRRTWTTVVAAGAGAPAVSTSSGVVTVTRDSPTQFTIPAG